MFLKRILFYVFSVVVSVTFFKIINDKESVFTKIGQNTLYVYLTQGAILKTLVTYEILPNNIILGNVLALAILIILTFVLGKFIVYFKKNIKGRIDIIWIRNLKVLKSH